ncbi:MAG: polysaccharide biosynthesis tyrosine autokinase [Gemmataceae bacterium]
MTPLPPNDPRVSPIPPHVLPAGPPLLAATVPPPPPIVNAPPTGPALLKALRRRWQVATVAAGVGGVVVAALVWFFMPPAKHTVRATFKLTPVVKNPLGRSGPEVNAESFQRTQVILLKSPLVVKQALKDPRVANLSILRDCQDGDDVITWFEKELKDRSQGTSEIMTVMLLSDKAEEAQLLLDAVTKAYLTEFVNAEFEARNARMAMYKKIKDDYDANARRLRDARKALNQKTGTNEKVLAYQAETLAQEISYKRSSLLRLQSELLDLQARVTTLGESDPSKLPLNDDGFIIYYRRNASYRNLEAQLEEAQVKLQDAKQKVSDKRDSPVLKRKEAEIADLERDLTALQKQMRPEAEAYWKSQTAQQIAFRRQTLTDELETKTKIVEGLKKEIADAELHADQLRQGVLQTDYFDKTNAATEEVYKAVSMKYEEMKLDASPEPRVKLIEEARIIPADARRIQIGAAAAAGVVTMIVILFGIALCEFRGRRVESVEQIVYGLGLPLVGTVPAMPRNRFMGLSGRMQSDEFERWRFALQEAVATARTMLLNASRTTDLRMVMITSATAGEGKTSLSTQLAVSLSMAGYRTLLLDFDMRNPSAYKLLGTNNAPGWAEILRGELNVAEAIQPTALPNLWFIPAGDCDPMALRTLAAEDLGGVLQWLRSQYDFVIVDTCPVLPVVDALLLGRHVDGVIFSILSEVSQIPKVYTATQRVASLGIRTLGVVINGIREEKYGYGYGHPYGNRSSQDRKKRTAAVIEASEKHSGED